MQFRRCGGCENSVAARTFIWSMFKALIVLTKTPMGLRLTQLGVRLGLDLVHCFHEYPDK